MGERYEKYLEGEYDSANKESQERKDISHAERIYNTVEKLKKEKRDALIDSVLGDEELPPGDEEAIRELFNEYASNKDEYLVDGAVLTCNMAYKGTCYIRGITYGTEVKNVENPRQTRLLVSDNKSEINGQPVATVKDHKEGVNIELFKCNCLNMPDREEEYEAFHDDEECKKYGICRKLMKLDNDWENFIRSTCYLSFSRSTEGDRAQGITMNSVLFCSHGGLITPVTSGQETYEATFIYIDRYGNTKEVIWNISDEEFVNYEALTLEEIEKICSSHNQELVDKGFAEGIYNYCVTNKLNPKVLLATLGQEQSWCKNGNYEKAFGVGPGGNPKNFSDSSKGIAASGNVYIKKYNEGLEADSLVLIGVNRDVGPDYKETKAALSGTNKSVEEWQNENSEFANYMEKGQDIECVNAAMYAKLCYTPWVDFPPSNSHPLEDWLSVYNSLEDCLKNE